MHVIVQSYAASTKKLGPAVGGNIDVLPQATTGTAVTATQTAYGTLCGVGNDKGCGSVGVTLVTRWNQPTVKAGSTTKWRATARIVRDFGCVTNAGEYTKTVTSAKFIKLATTDNPPLSLGTPRHTDHASEGSTALLRDSVPQVHLPCRRAADCHPLTRVDSVIVELVTGPKATPYGSYRLTQTGTSK